MRILVLNHEFPPIGGGGGRAAESICKVLAARGHEIKVLTARLGGLPARERRDGYEIIRIRSFRELPFRASLRSMLAYVLAGLWNGLRIVRSFNPELIHVHFAVPAGALAWMLSRLTKIPYVLTAHLGDVPGGVPEKTSDWFRWIFPITRWIWRDASIRVAVSEYTRELALKNYDEEILVIPNGVDINEVKPSSIKVHDPPVIVFAGRFMPQKAPGQVVRILHQIRDLPWKCVMIGDGPLLPDVKQEIAGHGLQDRFILPGWITTEEVMEWFERADILFMPSLSEGLPVVGVQALAMGLSIVASRVGGFVDLVEDGRNGYLFPSDEGASMAEALRSFLIYPETLLRARQNSREMSRQFDIVQIADAYEKLYQALVHPIPAPDEGRRILILNSEYPPVGGGAGNASANLARCLTSQGFTVTVVTSRFGDLPRRERQDNLTVIRIPAWRSRQDRAHAWELTFFILSACIWTLRIVAGHRPLKPNATLAFFGVPSGAVAYVLKLVHQIPYIISLRGGDVPGFRPYDFGVYHKLITPVLRIIWKKASVIVANSQGLRALALKFDSRFEIPIIPNGVDLNLYEKGNRDALSPPCLLSVGRIVHQKGIDLAMHALADMRDLDWKWRIAGDGPQMESLKRLAAELNLQDRLQFLGWQSREQLVDLYQWSNLFLFPSRHEGMPNAVLEAMASGLPVVATRISGSEELVVDWKTGFLVPSEDVISLQSALRNLLLNPALRREMGLASRRRVEEFYSWENAARQYAHLLEQVQ